MPQCLYAFVFYGHSFLCLSTVLSVLIHECIIAISTQSACILTCTVGPTRREGVSGYMRAAMTLLSMSRAPQSQSQKYAFVLSLRVCHIVTHAILDFIFCIDQQHSNSFPIVHTIRFGSIQYNAIQYNTIPPQRFF